MPRIFSIQPIAQRKPRPSLRAYPQVLDLTIHERQTPKKLASSFFLPVWCCSSFCASSRNKALNRLRLPINSKRKEAKQRRADKPSSSYSKYKGSGLVVRDNYLLPQTIHATRPGRYTESSSRFPSPRGQLALSLTPSPPRETKDICNPANAYRAAVPRVSFRSRR